MRHSPPRPRLRALRSESGRTRYLIRQRGQALVELANHRPVLPLLVVAPSRAWATFHVTSASRPDKTVTGYFKSNFVQQPLTIRSCSIDVDCPVSLGSFSPKLVD